MGSRTNPRSHETADAVSDSERSGEASSEQSIPTTSSSITFLSDEALVTARPAQDESTTWDRLLSEVAKAPEAKEIPSARDEDLETLLEGAAVGEYCIVRRLGRGTFGTVYQAVHPVIGKEVAVKVLNTRFAADAYMVRRFVEEARAVNRIRHPNIVDVFGFGELPDGRKFFVMELLDGETLAAMVEREGAISPEVTIAVLKDVASALDATHARGILHRDLSPGNIFLVKNAAGGIAAKLLDFGVAKMLNDSNGLGTQTGALIGTPAYMSPEQCRGAVLDHTSDIYSLGVIAHELLTGTRPFSGTTVEHFVTKHIYSPPPKVSECNAKLTPAIDKPVLRLLAKKPSERPSSASEGIADLERVFHAESGPSAKRVGLPKALALAGLALAILVPAGLFAAHTRSNEGATEPSTTSAEATAAPSPTVASAPQALQDARKNEPVAHVEEPTMPAPSATADAVIITWKGLPSGTAVFRGKHRLGNAHDGLVLPRSTTPLELTLYARGFKPELVKLVPDRNHELSPTLTRATAPARASAKRNVLGELEY